MMIKNYTIGSVHPIKYGFQAEVMNPHGKWTVVQFDEMLEKFFHVEGNKIKLPMYVMAELVYMAFNRGFIKSRTVKA